MPVVFVKNMVCGRCKVAVEQILDQMKIPHQEIRIGEIHLYHFPAEAIWKIFTARLESIGLEIIDNRRTRLIEKAKLLIIERARGENVEPGQKKRLSGYLSENLAVEYTHLSRLFTSVEGRTVETFFIEQRIEKVKELLVYDHRTLTEIAFMLDFSSVAHLSAQFKKTTGLTASHFKKIGESRMRALDRI